jgi:hypothetical protein
MLDQRGDVITDLWHQIKVLITGSTSVAIISGISFSEVVQFTAWLWIVIQIVLALRDRWWEPRQKRKRYHIHRKNITAAFERDKKAESMSIADMEREIDSSFELSEKFIDNRKSETTK